MKLILLTLGVTSLMISIYLLKNNPYIALAISFISGGLLFVTGLSFLGHNILSRHKLIIDKINQDKISNSN